jgi:hypothetical protein
MDEDGVAQSDVSRTLLVALVFITLCVSILGTWAVLSQVDAGRTPSPSPGSDHAEVGFSLAEPVPAPVSQSTGHVVLNIQ